MKRILTGLLCLLLCITVLLTPVSVARADFGDYVGDSDYGDDDDDYGYSGSSWSDDDDYSDTSYGGYIIGSFFSGNSSYLIIGLLVIGVPMLLKILSKHKKRAQQRPGNVPARNAGAARTDATILMPIGQYTMLDANFDAADMREKLANLYVQMQNCWQDKNIEPLRPYLSDALYAQMERQADMFSKQNRTNYVERIAVLGVLLRGYYQRSGDDHIVAELRTRVVDYTLNDVTGELISGDRKAERFMTYEWDISRPSGQTTALQKEQTSIHCPFCGAPLSINQSAKCPYCGSVIELAQHDWTINAIRGIAQRTQ